MSSPRFDDDLQMSAWFEDADLAELEVADDVVISRNLAMHVEWTARPVGGIGGLGTGSTVHGRNSGAATTAASLLLVIPN